MSAPPLTKALVVDDLKGVRQILCSILGKAGYETREAENGRQAIDLIRSEAPDVVLLDIRMPGMDGFEVLQQLQGIDPDLPVVMVTAYDDVDTAVQAMHLGAYHYLSKPFHNAEVLAIVERAVERRRLSTQVRSLQERVGHAAPVRELLGTSEAIGHLIDQIDRIAPTDLTALITGPHGTGKELVARALHARSPRRHGPFVTVDCGAVPAEFLESELFGYERGAFPGADRQRPGQLDLAAGGALYLADIGALPLGAQNRLLRFLQNRQLLRLGGAEPIALDVRIIAATSVDLRELVAGHLFRRDLYARLAEASLVLTPLRERRDDILYLVKTFLDATNAELGKNVQGPTPEALDLLLNHPWPGNLRELRHVVKRAVLLADDHIEPAHLAIPPTPRPQADTPPPEEEDTSALSLPERTRRAVERIERAAITDALRRSGGNKSRAARMLGIDYKTLHVKMKKYHLRANVEESTDDLSK
jgi:two-component system nitrogen regulation response regulator GlnG